MVEWYKEKTFVFKLKDNMVKQDLTIWKSWTKRNDPDSEFVKYFPGGEVKFPLKPGDAVKDVNGKVHIVEDLRMMKSKTFKAMFPDLNKSIKYIRTVLIGGLEYNYRFTYSINNRINDLISITQKIPDSYLKQTYFPNETPQKKYTLKPVTEDEAKEWEKNNLQATIETTGTSKAPSKEVADLQLVGVKMEEQPAQKKSNKTDFEVNFMDQISAITEKYGEEQFIKIFLATSAKEGEIAKYTEKGIKASDRAKQLYQEYK